MFAVFYLGYLIDRVGPERSLAFHYALGAVFIAVIALVALPYALLLVFTFFAGMTIIGSQTGLNGTCGKLYPARMRTTGLGWALGIGRLGGIAAPVLGRVPACRSVCEADADLSQRLRFRRHRRGGDRLAGVSRQPRPGPTGEHRVMKVFVFDLLAYDANLDHLKNGEPELPYPLAGQYFDADTAVRTYEEHLDAWELLDRLGYDGVGFNEHHCSPYGLMNSPNLMAASAAQRTKNLKLLIYGNLLPIHEPLRLAEELAMIDCLSKGRLISGFARGIPREYQVHNVPLAESRGRFEEAFDIITRAWTEEVFSYEGRFWS